MIPRDKLIPGVWDADLNTHPNKSYQFYSHGYKCKIKRNDFYVYCCYVYVGTNHPYFKDGEDALITVHGGITFVDEKGVFGYDCLHFGDLSPLQETLNIQYFNIPLKFGTHYWTFEEAGEETENMAKQFRDTDTINLDEVEN